MLDEFLLDFDIQFERKERKNIALKIDFFNLKYIRQMQFDVYISN